MYIINNSIQGFNHKLIFKAIFIIISIFYTSCEDYLDIDLSKAKIESSTVFDNDITATSAMTGIYVTMSEIDNFAAGRDRSVSFLTGLSSDELTYHRTTSVYVQFYQNILNSENSRIKDLWRTMYNVIYQSNAVIENLEISSNVSLDTKNQLTGEALFVRAFTHFYLVNLFGDVPLVTTTDFNINSTVPRSNTSQVYDQIVLDLNEASELLTDEYPSGERVRPNKACAHALLSRVYLYQGNWPQAESEASWVINNSAYSLLDDLNNVFLANSTESIWQLAIPNSNTFEAQLFVLTSSPSSSRPSSLTSNMLNSIESNDLRFQSWIGSVTASGNTYYFPYKYKIINGPTSNPPTPVSEYSTVLRLAEQYLIRSEARINQGDLSGSIEDLDVIRERAGLQLISMTNPTISQTELQLAIEKERRIELFTEWGHRWFDLKRWGKANLVLGNATALPWKSWNSEDSLYPIPLDELNSNPNLTQNDGY